MLYTIVIIGVLLPAMDPPELQLPRNQVCVPSNRLQDIYIPFGNMLLDGTYV